MLLEIGFAICLVYAVRVFLDFRRLTALYKDVPGFHTLFSVLSVLGNLPADPIKYISVGRERSFTHKHEDYKAFGQDVTVNLALFPSPHAIYQLADAAIIKEVLASRARFPKPLEQYYIVGFFGSNIVASEYDEWKRFRKICSPAFNEKNNETVWNVTIKHLTKLFDTWGKRDEVSIDNIVEPIMAVTLAVIASAGFGAQISLDGNDDIVPIGHKASFRTTMLNLPSSAITKTMTPDFILRWAPTKALKTARDSLDDLHLYLEEMLKERRSSEDKDTCTDLLSLLINASELDDGTKKMTDGELISNMFVFLFAGHETSGHTLSYALAMLALYPEEQEILFQHIQGVLPDGRVPTYRDMSKLTRCMAVLYETLRLFPTVPTFPKRSAEDTTFVVKNVKGETVVCPVPRNTSIAVHVAGLHYNPRYWEDPYAFKPSRFSGDWPKDAFIPFSGGARGCIGRGFFETSGVAFLSLLISRYKVEVMDEPEFAGENLEEKRRRVTKCQQRITVIPDRVPLTFKRR